MDGSVVSSDGRSGNIGDIEKTYPNAGLRRAIRCAERKVVACHGGETAI